MVAPIQRIVGFAGIFRGKAKWLVVLASGAHAIMTAGELALSTRRGS